MKYPQLVSMPSALQDWLDEQLEARGIDAVVYTRYILSLLQRDTLDPPDDLLSLSPNKVKEVGRRGRKRGRSREEYWNVWDCEQLKRSAAVECLKSASDQKCGIEKLVDELCAKLKEIQSEGESSVQLELSDTSIPNKPLSPQDQAQKYYAAFPPLNSKFAESSKSLITLIPEAGVWSGKKILADSYGKNKSCSEVLKEHNNWAEENKENGGNNSWKEIGRETMKSRNQMKDDALHLSKQKKEDCYGFAWNMAEERNNTCNDFVVGYGEDSVFVSNKHNTDAGLNEITGCRRLYERQMDEPVDHMEEEEADSSTDDLAQLIAKFDHSIEALWNPDDPSGSSDNVSSDGTLECEQELPLDFQQLLSSPSEQFVTLELYNKRNASVFSSRNSFIQCGTNITSSIWSDQPSLENSAEPEDYGMDYSFTEQASADSGLKNVLTGEEKTVGSKLYNREDGSIRNKEDCENCNNEKGSTTKSNLEWIGNNVTSFFTIHNTLNLVPERNTTQKWSEKSPVGNFCQNDGIGQVDEHAVQLFNNKVDIYNSLNTLNHNREGSSFTEVIPKQSSHTKSREKPNEANVKQTRDEPNEMADVEKEEEDLLTSTRTHFRPIRNDSLDSHSGSNTVGYYADGTTFVIPTSLDEVAFRRSESGALYLEADAGPETPKKYMEYKEKEVWHCYSDVYDSTREFVPKFRVRQNEKCCQTEEAEEQSTSDEEVDIKRSRHDTKGVSESEDFFFPDDKQFADKMEDKSELPTNNNSVCTSCQLLHKQQCNSTGLEIQCNIGSYGNVMQQTKHFCIKCDEHLMPHSCKFGWLKSPRNTAENVWQSAAANDKEDHLLDSWYTIWKSDPGETSGDTCTSCGEVQLMTDSKSLQYSRLREELTKDGEQLLSDLSYMQHLYQGSDWQDDSVPGRELEWNEDCKSPQEEELLYGEDSSAASKELQTKQAFESSSPVNMLKKETWLSTDLESEWTRNERPFTLKCLQKDRKRRHSASHRWACSCRLSHDLAGVPCRFWAGASCLKGMSCSSRTLRPVTL